MATNDGKAQRRRRPERRLTRRKRHRPKETAINISELADRGAKDPEQETQKLLHLQEFVAASASDLIVPQRPSLREGIEMSGSSLRLTAIALERVLEDMCGLLVASNGTRLRRLTPQTLFWETLSYIHYSASKPCLEKRVLLHDACPLAARVSVVGYTEHLVRIFGAKALDKLPKTTIRRYLAVGMSHFRHLEIGNNNQRPMVGSLPMYRDENRKGYIPLGNTWIDYARVKTMTARQREVRTKAQLDVRWPRDLGDLTSGAKRRRTLA